MQRLAVRNSKSISCNYTNWMTQQWGVGEVNQFEMAKSCYF